MAYKDRYDQFDPNTISVGPASKSSADQRNVQVFGVLAAAWCHYESCQPVVRDCLDSTIGCGASHAAPNIDQTFYSREGSVLPNQSIHGRCRLVRRTFEEALGAPRHLTALR